MVFRHRFGGRVPALHIWRGILLAIAVMLTVPLLVVAEDGHDSPRYPETATPTAIPTVPPTYAPTLTPTPTATPSPTALPTTATPSLPTATPDPLAGLTMIGHGPAAFYAPVYDHGGWEAIIRRHIQFGQADGGSFSWSPQGYYCVHPDYHIGNVLTLQNPRTGKTIHCTVADVVDAGDEALWRSRWKVELSYAAFSALALNSDENVVTVWVMKS